MENPSCHFVYYTGPFKGDAETFHTARITIGRASGNDFQLDDSADQAGTHHAEILLEEGGVYFLYDLGVKGGTYVNGERVHERCSLLNEDYIRFTQDGPEIIFRLGEPAPGKQKLPLVFPVTAELEFFSGSDAGRIFPINAAVVTNIGRRAELEIPLDPKGDMIVSGNHSNIRYVDGHFVLTDTSRNGTYVNGDLLDQPMEIIDGDTIMLGDGGPQARFRVDLAKRHYPNHRPLSPAKSVKPSVSALKPEPTPVAKDEKPVEEISQEPAAPPAKSPIAVPPEVAAKPLASAAPFASGNPLTESKLATKGDSAGDADAIPASDAAIEEADGERIDSDLDADMDIPEENTEEIIEPAFPATESQPQSSLIPLSGKLKFKPGQKVIFAAIGVVVVIGLIALLSGKKDSPADDNATVTSATGYTVKIPKGWIFEKSKGKISTESGDKNISVDYARDSRVSEATARELLTNDNAVLQADVRAEKAGDTSIKIMKSTLGSVERYAAVLQPAGGATSAISLVEGDEAAIRKLGKDELDNLLFKNVTLAKLDSPAPATTPKPTDAPTPPPANTPVVTAAPTPSPTPESAASPSTPTMVQAAVTPSTPIQDAGTSVPQVEEQTVASKALKLNVTVPKSWKATSEEENGMITLGDGKGLEVRIARDENQLDARGTFDAMKAEGWKEIDTKTSDPRYQAGEFSGSSNGEKQNLILVLTPEKAKSTLLIYATSKEDFTDDQRWNISYIVNQITAQ